MARKIDNVFLLNWREDQAINPARPAMLDSFTRHPHSVGETYGEHLSMAGGFGVTLIVAGAACLIHAVLPFAFERTASEAVERLYDRMASRRRAAQPGIHTHAGEKIAA